MSKEPSELIDGLPQDSEDIGLLLNTSSQEVVSRIKMAEVFVEALSFLETTARNRDFFTGYSLSEVITERLALIGSDDDNANSFNIRRRTLLSNLAYLEAVLLGTIDTAIESLETEGVVTPVVDTESVGL